VILFDSHCHLTSDAFSDDLEAVLARAHDAGVTGLTCIASTPRDAGNALALARRHGGIWCTAGIHPHEAAAVGPGGLEEVRALLAEPEVVAVGECGLDFHYDFAPRERQLELFRGQVELAGDTGLPLVVHSREADAEMTAELRAGAGELPGVLHCFTGGDDLLETALDAGWYVSFTGMITFRRFDAAERVRRVPADRLMVETDSPYLAPVPHRGQRNEPAHVVATLEKMAEMRGVTPLELAEVTTANARRFYGLDAAASPGGDDEAGAVLPGGPGGVGE
jgi:TatD DNase family protein